MRPAAALLLVAAVLAEDAGPGKTRLDEANREAAKEVYRTVAREGSDVTNRLRGLKKEDVIVVGGLFDFVQEVLTAYRTRWTRRASRSSS
jgi:hypothetical protein